MESNANFNDEFRGYDDDIKRRLLTIAKGWAEPIAEAIVLIIALNLLLWPIKIEGSSMEQSIRSGDWVFGCKAATWIAPPKTGDVVLFKVKGVSGQIVKRVIATEGDHVVIKDGSVFVNDEELKEEYIDGSTDGNHEITVGAGKFYALGDNRATSTDSRSFGDVPIENIKSRILIRFLPFKEVRGYF